jgi:glucose-6-phosphate isomerase
MSTMLKEVYDALKEAGASEEKASAAAVAVSAYQLDRAHLATKEDIAKLEAKIEKMGRVIIMWNVGTLVAIAGLVFAIMRFTSGGGP